MLGKFYVVFENIVPEILKKPLLSFISAFFYIFRCEYFLTKKNVELVAVAKKRRAFILATGPSVRDQDILSLKGEDCFTVSNFILHENLKDINPKLHFVAPYHPPLIYSEYVEWLKTMDEILPDSTGIVLSCKSKGMVDKENLFSKRKVYYISTQKALWTLDVNIIASVLSPQSSPLMVIPVLYAMGYKEIFLVGCDHNILKDYGGVVSNFYQPERDARQNATSGSNWDAGIIKHLTYAKNVFKQYEYYSRKLERKGIRIYNCSPTSWLDFIPYKSFDEAKK